MVLMLSYYHYQGGDFCASFGEFFEETLVAFCHFLTDMIHIVIHCAVEITVNMLNIDILRY